MQKLFVLAAFLFFSTFIQAQVSNTAVAEKSENNVSAVNKKTDKKSSEVKTGTPGKSKIVVPPEKAAPINIPLTVAPPTIDGESTTKRGKPPPFSRIFTRRVRAIISRLQNRRK
jgi:hypothetical protein